MTEQIHVDLTPISEFRYCQISNHLFQFLLLDKNNRALHSPFECKDYLQDIFYCEYTGKNAGIYGISWKPGMLDINVETFRLALHGGKVTLDGRVEMLQKFLNEFENSLGIQPSTVSATDDSKIIVVDFSKEWTSNGPLLSAFTTLIRLSGTYNGENPIEYLSSLLQYKVPANRPQGFPDYMLVDIKRLDNTLPKFAALLEGRRPEHQWDNFKSIMFVHDTGIVGFKDFPKANVAVPVVETIPEDYDEYDEGDGGEDDEED